MEITVSDGKHYQSQFYSLDAIIAVGYRVNSVCATQFRQWATSILKVYAIRGYVLDRERMENGTFLSEDYFEHLLAEIREIRLSEWRFYQKLNMRNTVQFKTAFFKVTLTVILECCLLMMSLLGNPDFLNPSDCLYVLWLNCDFIRF